MHLCMRRRTKLQKNIKKWNCLHSFRAKKSTTITMATSMATTSMFSIYYSLIFSFFFNSLFFPCSFFSCIISKYFFLIFMECHMAGYSCVTVCIFYFIHIFIQTGCSFVQENVLFVLSTYTNTNNSFSCMKYKNSFYLISAYI